MVAKLKKYFKYLLIIAVVAFVITLFRLDYFDKKTPKELSKTNLPPELEFVFMGNEAYHKDEFQNAIHYYTIAIKKLKEQYIENAQKIAIYYDKLGKIYCLLRELDKALECFSYSMDIKKNFHWHIPEELATSYENIAYIHYTKRNFNKTLDYLEKAKALRLQSSERNYFDIANTYFFISKVYDTQENTNTALRYYKKVLQIRKDRLADETQMTAYVHYEIGLKHYQLKQYDQAITHYTESINIYNKLPGFYNQQIINLYNSLGHAFYKKGDYRQAIASLKNVNILEKNFSTSELFDLIMNKRPIHYVKEQDLLADLLFFAAGLFLGTFFTYQYLNRNKSYSGESVDARERPSRNKKSELNINPKVDYPEPPKEKPKKFKPIKIKASRIGDPFTPDEVILDTNGVTFKIKEELGSTEDYIIYSDISGIKAINGVKFYKLMLAHLQIEPKNRKPFMIKFLTKKDAKFVKEYIQEKAK